MNRTSFKGQTAGVDRWVWRGEGELQQRRRRGGGVGQRGKSERWRLSLVWRCDERRRTEEGVGRGGGDRQRKDFEREE